jgi:hypothetical protein
MHATRHAVALTTAADGSATGYTPNVTGRILGIRYVKTDFADGVDFTITLEATGEAILTLTNQNAAGTFYPRVPVQDEAGADATLDGTRKMRDAVVAVHDRVKIVIAAGGNVKTGAVHVIVG